MSRLDFNFLNYLKFETAHIKYQRWKFSDPVLVIPPTRVEVQQR